MVGNEREALLAVAERLSVELGYAEAAAISANPSAWDGESKAMGGILDSEDEALIATIRLSLSRLAAALGGEVLDASSRTAVNAALDGAELVMRGELLIGNFARLPALLPSFVFLVTLTLVDQERALELSRKTAQLIEGALQDREGH